MGEDGELMTVSQLIERLESMDKGRQVLLHTGGKDQAPKEVSSVVAGVCLPHGASPGAVLDYDQFHSDVVEVVVLKTED